MNKKFLTMLLALAMIISMVPMVVGAECAHENVQLLPIENNQHAKMCLDCYQITEATSVANCYDQGDGRCVCGRVMEDDAAYPDPTIEPVEEEPCKHPAESRCNYTQNAVFGGHDYQCADCQQFFNENHTFVDGKCICGATNEDYSAPEVPVCEHEEKDYFYKSIDSTHHKIICLNCGETVKDSEECHFVDGKCEKCSNTKVVEPEVTEPATTTVNPNLDVVPKTGSSFLEWLYALIFG